MEPWVNIWTFSLFPSPPSPSPSPPPHHQLWGLGGLLNCSMHLFCKNSWRDQPQAHELGMSNQHSTCSATNNTLTSKWILCLYWNTVTDHVTKSWMWHCSVTGHVTRSLVWHCDAKWIPWSQCGAGIIRPVAPSILLRSTHEAPAQRALPTLSWCHTSTPSLNKSVRPCFRTQGPHCLIIVYIFTHDHLWLVIVILKSQSRRLQHSCIVLLVLAYF